MQQYCLSVAVEIKVFGLAQRRIVARSASLFNHIIAWDASTAYTTNRKSWRTSERL
jgi:hypothetical protein